MNAGPQVINNLVTLAVLAAVGWLIYKKYKGEDAMAGFSGTMDNLTKYHK